ncbi:MAG: hypothetical protein GX973_04550 [Firmicutes bacterium]|nr:hypothetical protein [Bacillota bacterium]
MIIYTPLPLEWVLSGYDSFKPQYRELEYGEGRLIVEMLSPDQGRVVRLISPRPADYLVAENQPGTRIAFKLLKGEGASGPGEG